EEKHQIVELEVEEAPTLPVELRGAGMAKDWKRRTMSLTLLILAQFSASLPFRFRSSEHCRRRRRLTNADSSLLSLTSAANASPTPPPWFVLSAQAFFILDDGPALPLHILSVGSSPLKRKI
ncbi:hypothetical protein PIB30_089718, partial [Stylosanthes scabra]|nr:hypothetical protein [Stylosanthes scabra]